jgi:hypothetical protein
VIAPAFLRALDDFVANGDAPIANVHPFYRAHARTREGGVAHPLYSLTEVGPLWGPRLCSAASRRV